MGIFHVPNSLDGYDMFTVNAYQRSNTGVHGGMVDLLCCGVDVGDDLL